MHTDTVDNNNYTQLSKLEPSSKQDLIIFDSLDELNNTGKIMLCFYEMKHGQRIKVKKRFMPTSDSNFDGAKTGCLVEVEVKIHTKNEWGTSVAKIVHDPVHCTNCCYLH